MSTVTMSESQANQAAEAPATPARTRRHMTGRGRIILIIVSLVLMALFRTGFVFLIIGLLPSIVAYYMDVTRPHFTFKTIFCFNLSAMMPYIAKILSFGPSSSVMQEIMGDGKHWMLIYGAAMLGWIIGRLTPMVAHIMISGFHATQVSRLHHNQKRIEGEWGQEVTQFSKREHEEDE